MMIMGLDCRAASAVMFPKGSHGAGDRQWAAEMGGSSANSSHDACASSEPSCRCLQAGSEHLWCSMWAAGLAWVPRTLTDISSSRNLQTGRLTDGHTHKAERPCSSGGAPQCAGGRRRARVHACGRWAGGISRTTFLVLRQSTQHPRKKRSGKNMSGKRKAEGGRGGRAPPGKRKYLNKPVRETGAAQSAPAVRPACSLRGEGHAGAIDRHKPLIEQLGCV